MSVQTTQVEIAHVEVAIVEIARAKLITGLIVLAVMAGSCAPQMLSAKTQQPPAASAATAR
jgi:hypothetical protein